MALTEEVDAARLAAHLKHGENSIERLPANHPRWLAILVEEVGEVANALTYDGKGDLRAELLDVIVVATAWIARVDGQDVSWLDAIIEGEGPDGHKHYTWKCPDCPYGSPFFSETPLKAAQSLLSHKQMRHADAPLP